MHVYQEKAKKLVKSQLSPIADRIREPSITKDTYLLPAGEKQRANNSSSAVLRIPKLGERDTGQIHCRG